MKISELIVKLQEVINNEGDGDAGVTFRTSDGEQTSDFDVVGVDDEGFIIASETV